MTNEHPYREEDFDLYALGVLEGDELRGIETHVNSCADCAQKVAEARGRISMLAFSAKPQEPSLEVRQRLMARVRAEANPCARSIWRETGKRVFTLLEFCVGCAGCGARDFRGLLVEFK